MLVDRKDLQELSRIRLKEATALLNLALFDGAYYLAGYAVECALKACIAKRTQRCEFPDKKRVDLSHTHNLRDLFRVAGLDKACLEQAGKDPDFGRNWDAVQLWSEQSRYQRNGRESAQLLLNAVGDRRHGVISWIKLHW
jgi:HEPN domain-containing protein